MSTFLLITLLLVGVGLLALGFLLARKRQNLGGAQAIAAFGICFTIAGTVDLLPLEGLWAILVAGLLGLVAAELVFRRGPLRTTRKSPDS